MKCILPVKERHEFAPRDFIAGDASIDFVNTVTGRNGSPRDWLIGPDALTEWGLASGVLNEAEAEGLAGRYQSNPDVGNADLKNAVELREAMCAVLSAATESQSPNLRALSLIERAWANAAVGSRLKWNEIEGLLVEPYTVAARVVTRFVALGRELHSPRLRRCAGDDCGWFFVDTSKAGRRRWCDMATCGNSAKYVRSRN
jgi:predicted RNA-binding Zn ribbon-like protein